jgi:hypothetical protein
MASSAYLWTIHGLIGAIAVFIVLPLGALKFRVTALPSWLPHWATQSIGTILLLVTGGVGLFQTSSIHSGHQVAGLSLLALVLLQSFLGHCMSGLANRENLRTWSLATHTVQGFTILFLGWWTVVTGLQLASFGSTMIIVTSLATLTEITAVVFFCAVKRYKSRYSKIPTFIVHDESDEEMEFKGSDGQV